MVATWDQLPAEVKLHIFADAEPSDLGTLLRVSKAFNSLIEGNQLLFKDIYLQRWDDPIEHASKLDVDYEDYVHQAVAASKLVNSPSPETRREALPLLAKYVTTLSSIASTSSDRTSLKQRNITYLSSLFSSNDSSMHDSPLAQSALFARARGQFINHASEPHARSQQLASAKLHCLYGVPQLLTDGVDVYPYAASKIYDLRNYTLANHWGPFLDDGSNLVDWEKLEAIMLVLGHNIQRIDSDGESNLARLWQMPFSGTTPWSYKPVKPACPHAKHGPAAPWCRTKPDPELEKLDPYGISGTWLRIVCFLDYRDLYDYNFNPANHEPRYPLNTDEAVRLIVMTLVVTSVQWPEDDDTDQDSILSDAQQADVPPSPKPARKSMPIVTFTGTARALHSAFDPNANSKIRGTISTTPEGEVRWTNVSVYPGGEERWKSEGIQVGGIKSARGVLGTWFDKDYAAHGPAGPTAFWKIRDDVFCEDGGDRRRGVGAGLGGLGGWQQDGGSTWPGLIGVGDHDDDDDDMSDDN